MPNDASKSSIDSQKPTTYMAQATALANENINPIEPPNSGPKLLDICNENNLMDILFV